MGCCNRSWFGKLLIWGNNTTNAVPVNSVAPVASNIGSGLLSTTPGTWSGFAEKITYQWYKNAVLISGATGKTYQTDSPGTYKVSVNEININGAGTAVFSNNVVV